MAFKALDHLEHKRAAAAGASNSKVSNEHFIYYSNRELSRDLPRDGNPWYSITRRFGTGSGLL